MMAEISVFECGICYFRYNEADRAPTSLPCGHVYCRSCLFNFKSGSYTICPVDKQAHAVSVEKLPLCYAILTNLPSPKSPNTCSKHPRKKVKFVCKSHSKYLCSDCVLDHTGLGHEVVAFSPSAKDIEKEVQHLVEGAEEVVSEMKDYLQGQNSQDRRISAFYDSQILKVSSSFDSVIRMLTNRKKELIETLRKHMKEQQVSLEMFRIKNSKKLEGIINWAKELKVQSENLGELSYEQYTEFVAQKKSELKSLNDSKKPSEIECKYYVYNDTLSVQDTGSVSQMKEVPEEKSWKCRSCQQAPVKVFGAMCGPCRNPKYTDFAASHGPETHKYMTSPKNSKLKESKKAPPNKNPQRKPSKKKLFNHPKPNNSF